MLLPEKYESIFDVSSKGPSSGSLVNKDGRAFVRNVEDTFIFFRYNRRQKTQGRH